MDSFVAKAGREPVSIDTEREQYVIGVVIGEIRLGIVALFDKMKELESREPTEDAPTAMMAIKLRIDTLIKIEKDLLEPLQSEYAHIERSVGEIVPGELMAIADERQKKMIKSLLYGFE